MKLAGMFVTALSLAACAVAPEDVDDVSADTTDEPILAAAVASGAAVLVTGDADLLAVATGAPLPILGPRDFWIQQRTG